MNDFDFSQLNRSFNESNETPPDYWEEEEKTPEKCCKCGGDMEMDQVDKRTRIPHMRCNVCGFGYWDDE